MNSQNRLKSETLLEDRAMLYASMAGESMGAGPSALAPNADGGAGDSSLAEPTSLSPNATVAQGSTSMIEAATPRASGRLSGTEGDGVGQSWASQSRADHTESRDPQTLGRSTRQTTTSLQTPTGRSVTTETTTREIYPGADSNMDSSTPRAYSQGNGMNTSLGFNATMSSPPSSGSLPTVGPTTGESASSPANSRGGASNRDESVSGVMTSGSSFVESLPAAQDSNLSATGVTIANPTVMSNNSGFPTLPYDPNFKIDPDFKFDPNFRFDPNFGYDPDFQIDPDFEFDPNFSFGSVTPPAPASPVSVPDAIAPAPGETPPGLTIDPDGPFIATPLADDLPTDGFPAEIPPTDILTTNVPPAGLSPSGDLPLEIPANNDGIDDISLGADEFVDFTSEGPEFLPLDETGGLVVDGFFQVEGDQDIFGFEVVDQFPSYVVETSGNLDTILSLLDADSETIVTNDDFGNFFNSRVQAPLTPGQYFVGVGTFDGAETGPYQVLVSPSQEVLDAPLSGLPGDDLDGPLISDLDDIPNFVAPGQATEATTGTPVDPTTGLPVAPSIDVADPPGDQPNGMEGAGAVDSLSDVDPATLTDEELLELIFSDSGLGIIGPAEPGGDGEPVDTGQPAEAGDPVPDDFVDFLSQEPQTILLSDEGGAEITGSFEAVDDQDLFGFEVVQDFPSYVIELNSDLDTVLTLLDSDGEIIVENDDNGLRFDSRVQAPLPPGYYYVGSTTFSRLDTGAYVVRIIPSDEVIDMPISGDPADQDSLDGLDFPADDATATVDDSTPLDDALTL